MHSSTSPDQNGSSACSQRALAPTSCTIRRAEAESGSRPSSRSWLIVKQVAVQGWPTCTHSLWSKPRGMNAPPSHWPSSSSRASSRAPQPSVSTRPRCADHSCSGASSRSRMTCHRTEGSVPSNHSTADPRATMPEERRTSSALWLRLLGDGRELAHPALAQPPAPEAVRRGEVVDGPPGACFAELRLGRGVRVDQGVDSGAVGAAGLHAPPDPQTGAVQVGPEAGEGGEPDRLGPGHHLRLARGEGEALLQGEDEATSGDQGRGDLLQEGTLVGEREHGLEQEDDVERARRQGRHRREVEAGPEALLGGPTTSTGHGVRAGVHPPVGAAELTGEVQARAGLAAAEVEHPHPGPEGGVPTQRQHLPGGHEALLPHELPRRERLRPGLPEPLLHPRTFDHVHRRAPACASTAGAAGTAGAGDEVGAEELKAVRKRSRKEAIGHSGARSSGRSPACHPQPEIRSSTAGSCAITVTGTSRLPPKPLTMVDG